MYEALPFSGEDKSDHKKIIRTEMALNQGNPAVCLRQPLSHSALIVGHVPLDHAAVALLQSLSNRSTTWFKYEHLCFPAVGNQH